VVSNTDNTVGLYAFRGVPPRAGIGGWGGGGGGGVL